MLDGRGGIGGEADAAGGVVFLDEAFEAWLEDRDEALVEPFHLAASMSTQTT